jgi:hypothetical protein
MILFSASRVCECAADESIAIATRPISFDLADMSPAVLVNAHIESQTPVWAEKCQVSILWGLWGRKIKF